jgi:two-component system sensor histidine kinase MtrB
VGLAFIAPLRRVWLWWTRSLSLRVVTSTLAVGLVSVALLGAYVTNEIRDGLVDKRVGRILSESARDVLAAQDRVNASTAESEGDLQQLVNDVLESLGVVGGDTRGLVLLPDPSNDSDVPILVGTSDLDLVSLISTELRDAVEPDGGQFWQFAQMPDGAPAAVVGAPLDIGKAGPYELYFVYSLEPEQDTLGLILRVLAFGAGALVGLVLFMTWFVTSQAVRPVRDAALVAQRLAEGSLTERMEVKGNDEIATLATTFNEMAESLQVQITRMERLSRLQRRFVSDVSHELRTPLTTIRMASDVLYDSRDGFPPEVARSAELLGNQLDRFEDLLADLLEISRIDAGAAQLDFEDNDLADIVRDQMELMSYAARGAGVELRLWVAPGDHTASMDRPRVSRIVRNLLSNAVEHAQGRPVDVAVASTGRTVGVVVRDYGVGLTKQQVDRVFDRFWRADPARARTMGGTGLGLSIAREDAQLHDGALEAWGEEGKGAAFRLMLPRTSRGLGIRPPVPLEVPEADFPELGGRIDIASPGVKS